MYTKLVHTNGMASQNQGPAKKYSATHSNYRGNEIHFIFTQFLTISFVHNILFWKQHSLSIDKKRPAAIAIEPYAECGNKSIVLIDDVANSGKTMLYALKPLLKAYPKKIQTLAMVERTHKSFPVGIDYTGLSVSTEANEHIYVEVGDGEVLGDCMQGQLEVCK